VYTFPVLIFILPFALGAKVIYDMLKQKNRQSGDFGPERQDGH
jgi:hypothetical protein